MNRPTITDLTRAAGVPVDRVLNARLNVRAAKGPPCLLARGAWRVPETARACSLRRVQITSRFTETAQPDGLAPILLSLKGRVDAIDAAPEFQLLDTQINLETRQLTYEATINLLARHEDLVALYVAGGGREGAIQAVRERRAAKTRLMLIVNELTPESQAGLQDHTRGIVLRTPMRALPADLIAQDVATAEKGLAETPGQRFFTAEIWTPESELMRSSHQAPLPIASWMM